MHAYLITGQESDTLFKKAKDLAQKLGKDSFEYSITKISQVRDLARFLKLSVSSPTTIIIKDIENATEESLNAFLKMLEEPQENIKYILTATSEYKIIPTISSRCQLIKVKTQKSESKNSEIISNFVKMSVGEKFLLIDKIRQRPEALKFITDYILYLHKLIANKDIDLTNLSYLISIAEDTFIKIKANGNINLNLTNLVIKSRPFSFTKGLI